MRSIDILWTFLRLGCVAFGGPAAHLGHFHQWFVHRRGWLDEAAYARLVALCQLLPGPASSQVGFAIGLHRGGLAGGLAAWVGFTLPSAALMTAFAVGVARTTDLAGAGWVTGLKIAAVAVVAHAVLALGRRLCPDWPRRLLAAAAAIAALLLPGSIGQMAILLAAAGLAPLVLPKADAAPAPGDGTVTAPLTAWLSGICFAALFLATFAASADPDLELYAALYRAGALVFGGGHVVLPLLEADVVATGLIPGDSFLAGYGAAQALPGPLFTIAAFLGATATTAPIPAAAAATVAIFLPGLLLVLAALPLWQRLSHQPSLLRCLQAVNAAVVGLIAAVLADPLVPATIQGGAHLALAAIAFAALWSGRCPVYLVVGGCAGLGWLVT